MCININMISIDVFIVIDMCRQLWILRTVSNYVSIKFEEFKVTTVKKQLFL